MNTDQPSLGVLIWEVTVSTSFFWDIVHTNNGRNVTVCTWADIPGVTEVLIWASTEA